MRLIVYIKRRLPRALLCQTRAIDRKTPELIRSGSLPLWRDGNRGLNRVELLAKPFALATCSARFERCSPGEQCVIAIDPNNC